MNEKIARLRGILDDSTYTVALYSSGIMGEDGFIGVKRQDEVHDIESRYGCGAGETYTNAFYNTRLKRFFESYKKKMLHNAPRDTASDPALTAMERAGKLQCVIDSNTYNRAPRGGCRYVTNLHGSIYQNQCPRCKKKCPIGYIVGAKWVPVCGDCSAPIRPMISLIGETVDNQDMTRTTEEITEAGILLLLGITLASEAFRQYI